MQTLSGKNILMIVSGGIAAYKSLELIRLLKKADANVRCVLTKGGAEFVTPLSLAALSENPVYTDLWSLKDETEMGHIRLAREADLVVIAPASANLLAKMAHGLADDLASTLLLANDTPVLACPAMNPVMWANPATRKNVETLKENGFQFIDPPSGEMACGEVGAGRFPEPADILTAIVSRLDVSRPLIGLKALVTAGPTFEPLDPVRYIGNRSSGKQGFAIARALSEKGADVTLVTGPVSLPDLNNIKTIRIETALDMLNSCQKSLPVDIAVFAAAVADWAPAVYQESKIKKTPGIDPVLNLKRNADVLSTIASTTPRPKLVVGFAAETDDLIENAERKRIAKGCDWLVANAVDANGSVFGADHNQVTLLDGKMRDSWPSLSKDDVARRLVERVIEHFAR